MLFPFTKEEKERDVMMNSVAPVWDGNETWLVMGGGGLFAVFPLAYAVVLPALYMPITLMLLALVFRGVAFEYRWRTERWKHVWDMSFAGGSYMAAFTQGIALGALVQGIEIENRAYAGGWWDSRRRIFRALVHMAQSWLCRHRAAAGGTVYLAAVFRVDAPP